MFEDLQEAIEAVESQDAIQLWETNYFVDAERWLADAVQDLEESARESAWELRASMEGICNNDDYDSVDSAQAAASKLHDTLTQVIEKLAIVQRIAEKARDHHYD